MEENKKIVVISENLYEKMEEKSKQYGFKSVSEFLEFFIKELLLEMDNKERELIEKDVQMIKDRLKALGYMDGRW